jgi:hypothetical protein
MHLCRGTRARVQSTVADTGDRFFSPFPSSACRLSLQTLETLLVLWQVAESLVIPSYSLRLSFSTCISFVLLLLLAGVALCREPLHRFTFYSAACATARPRTLPSRALSCRRLYHSRPPTAFDRAGLPEFFTTLCVIDDFKNRYSPYTNNRFGILLAISSVGHRRCLGVATKHHQCQLDSEGNSRLPNFFNTPQHTTTINKSQCGTAETPTFPPRRLARPTLHQCFHRVAASMRNATPVPRLRKASYLSP